jgi:hypothetical protein
MRFMKISIPIEAINHFMANYHCSEEEAAKVYLDAVKNVVPINTLF